MKQEGARRARASVSGRAPKVSAREATFSTNKCAEEIGARSARKGSESTPHEKFVAESACGQGERPRHPLNGQSQMAIGITPMSWLSAFARSTRHFLSIRFLPSLTGFSFAHFG